MMNKKRHCTPSDFAKSAMRVLDIDNHQSVVLLSRQQAQFVSEKCNLSIPGVLWKQKEGKNLFSLSMGNQHKQTEAPVRTSNATYPVDGYVPWGIHGSVKKIIKSGKFLPTYISGDTGCGKTIMVSQVCSELNRDLIRVNFTAHTDEDDLIGGFRLNSHSNGGTDMVFVEGPVIVAMRTGSILLLDEIDLGSVEIMCLQSILEGGSYHIKKTNTTVDPKPGFNIIATANTKGDGVSSEYVGTNVLNKAFMDRFKIAFCFSYPNKSTELKILLKALESNGLNSEDDIKFANNLSIFSEIIKRTANNLLTDINTVISTRKLVDIISIYSVFKKSDFSVKQSLVNFPEEIAESFYLLWMNLDDRAREMEETND